MDSSTDIKKLAQQLTALQRSLYVYIVSLIQKPVDAEDILQNANCVIWEKLDQFDPETDFTAWAYSIARYEVMTWRKKMARDRLQFSDDTLDRLAIASEDFMSVTSSRRDAMHDCMGKLRDQDQQLIHQQYTEQLKVREIAAEAGRSEKSVYHSLSRIRQSLLECIKRTLSRESR